MIDGGFVRYCSYAANVSVRISTVALATIQTVARQRWCTVLQDKACGARVEAAGHGTTCLSVPGCFTSVPYVFTRLA